MVISSPAKSRAARLSRGAAGTRPSVTRTASPSSSRPGGRGTPAGRGADRAAREISCKSSAVANRPANNAAYHASRYVWRASAASSGSSCSAAFTSSAGASLPAQQVGAGLLELIQRLAIAMLSSSAAASSASACRLACAATRATGETVRKRTVDTREALTVQEAQVARLAAEAHTNPEIGAQLFIRPPDRGVPPVQVFSKLGISSAGSSGTAWPNSNGALPERIAGDSEVRRVSALGTSTDRFVPPGPHKTIPGRRSVGVRYAVSPRD
jgi:hypothetical protein